jgi:diguanylate cyclase (GGDEF)-like protein
MLATRDVEQLLTLITEAFIEVSEGERGFLFLLDRETGVLVQRVALTNTGVKIPNSESRISTIANRVLKHGKPIFTNDGEQQSAICIPLSNEAEPFGVLFADGDSDDLSTNEIADQPHQESLAILADHAAAAITNARMFERTTNDPLTGLPNSSYFLVELANQMREASTDQPAGILLLDLDAFKRVNAAGGAETGDRALIEIGATLQEILRTDGFVARYGSDKFAVLLPPDGALGVNIRLRDAAERARAAIAAKSYRGIQLSVCIGGIGFPQDGLSNAQDVVARADDLLRTARSRGHGELEFH